MSQDSPGLFKKWKELVPLIVQLTPREQRLLKQVSIGFLKSYSLEVVIRKPVTLPSLPSILKGEEGGKAEACGILRVLGIACR